MSDQISMRVIVHLVITDAEHNIFCHQDSKPRYFQVLKTLPEIGDKMTTVYILIYTRIIHSAFHFCKEIRRM